MKRNLPAVQKDSLARVKNNLDILNKLINIDKELQIDEQGKRIIAFFSNNSEAFILSISRYYPLSYSLIEKYQDIWDWLDLTVNKNINWPLNFLEKYSTKLHLPNLFQKNKNLIWSDQLINIGIKQLGKDYFIHCIANYTDFKWSISLLKEYYTFLDARKWRRLSQNPNLPWTEELIILFEDNWDWKDLSSNESLPWTEELVAKYADKWDWSILSKNESLPWNEKFIAKYQNRFVWGDFIRNADIYADFRSETARPFFDFGLSSNKALPWSEEFIQQYNDKICWVALSINEGVPWSLIFIKKNITKLSKRLLQGNRSLPWAEILSDKTIYLFNAPYNYGDNYFPWFIVEKYPNIYPYAKRMKDYEIYREYGQYFPSFSGNTSLPWSKELIEEYVGVWNWGALSANSAIRWTTEIIEKFIDNLYWPTLLESSTFPWTFGFFEKHWDSIKECLIKDRYCTAIPEIAFNKIFKPFLNDTLIDIILKEIIGKNKMK